MVMKQQVSLLVSYWPLEMIIKYPIDAGPDIIQLPESIGKFACSVDKLVYKVYPDLLSNFMNMTWLSERCILALLNETTRTINATLVA